MNINEKMLTPTSNRECSITRATSSGTILAVGILGVLSTLLIATLLGHFGLGVAIALVLGVPLAVLLVALAVPQAARNVASLRGKINQWHILWLLSYVSALVFRVREAEASRVAPLDFWGTFRIGPEIIILFVLLVCLASRRTDWVSSLFRGLFGFLAAYCLWSAISTAWSVYPLWTFFKASEYLLDVSLIAAIVIAMYCAEDYKIFFDWTWTLFGVELLWVWVQVVLWPQEALEDGRLRGVFPVTAYNAVGEIGALLAIVALCRLLPTTLRRFNRAWYTSLFLFGLASMLMSQTRNALAGFVLALAVVIFLWSRKLAVVLALASAGVMTTQVYFSYRALYLRGCRTCTFFSTLHETIWTFLKRGQDEGAFASLTGRLDWWTYAWHRFLQHPFTGMGAYAGGKFAVLEKLGFNAGSTHSDYIELLVGSGIPGLVLFAIPLAGAWLLLFRYLRDLSFSSTERQLCLESLGVLSVITVHSFFNVELTWHSPMFFLVVVGYAEFLRRRKAALFVPAMRPNPLQWTKAQASSHA
jgi:O-antigen ligase